LIKYLYKLIFVYYFILKTIMNTENTYQYNITLLHIYTSYLKNTLSFATLEAKYFTNYHNMLLNLNTDLRVKIYFFCLFEQDIVRSLFNLINNRRFAVVCTIFIILRSI